MKVWITKYALSNGIKELEVEQSDSNPDMVCSKAWNDYYHGEGKEWHRTYKTAVTKAEEMRLKKIESLKKQIAKYEKLSFTKKSEEKNRMDEIMMICCQALEDEGYKVEGFSETYQKFTVMTDAADVVVDFSYDEN